jgi:hypothetical protein
MIKINGLHLGAMPLLFLLSSHSGFAETCLKTYQEADEKRSGQYESEVALFSEIENLSMMNIEDATRSILGSGGTINFPKAKQLYKAYSKEYCALKGSPLGNCSAFQFKEMLVLLAHQNSRQLFCANDKNPMHISEIIDEFYINREFKQPLLRAFREHTKTLGYICPTLYEVNLPKIGFDETTLRLILNGISAPESKEFDHALRVQNAVFPIKSKAFPRGTTIGDMIEFSADSNEKEKEKEKEKEGHPAIQYAQVTRLPKHITPSSVRAIIDAIHNDRTFNRISPELIPALDYLGLGEHILQKDSEAEQTYKTHVADQIFMESLKSNKIIDGNVSLNGKDPQVQRAIASSLNDLCKSNPQAAVLIVKEIFNHKALTLKNSIASQIGLMLRGDLNSVINEQRYARE